MAIYTEKQVKALVEACEKWRQEHNPGCPEALYQVDSVHEALPDLAEAVGTALGWWEDTGYSNRSHV